LLKYAELAGWDILKNMLSPIDVPEVKVSSRRSPNTACTKTTERHPLPGTIIKIAGVTNGIRLFPTQTNRALPSAGGNFGRIMLICHPLILGCVKAWFYNRGDR
jgi:hypothetical protein